MYYICNWEAGLTEEVKGKLSFKQWYLVYSLCVIIAFSISLMVVTLYAFPSGDVLLHFNAYGEHFFEAFLAVSSLPGLIMVIKQVIKSL